MKRILFFIAFSFFTLAASGQMATKDSLYLDTVIVSGITSWQLCRVIEYDNGQSNTNCSEYVDSTEMNRRLFRDAHQSLRPLAAAYKTTAIEFNLRATFAAYSALLDSLSSMNYYTQSAVRFGTAWQGLLISVTDLVADSTFFAQIRPAGNALEVLNAQINYPAGTYSFSGFKGGGYNKTPQYNAQDHIRLPLVFGANRDFVLIGKQVVQGVETGNEFWKDKDNKYRLIVFRELTAE